MQRARTAKLRSLKFIFSAEGSLVCGSEVERGDGMGAIYLTQERYNEALCTAVAVGVKPRPSTVLAK